MNKRTFCPKLVVIHMSCGYGAPGRNPEEEEEKTRHRLCPCRDTRYVSRSNPEPHMKYDTPSLPTQFGDP